MRNRYVLSPFFLGDAAPGLARLAESEWLLNPALPTGATQIERMADVHARLADIVTASVRSGTRPVCVGGDCCAAIGVLAGLQRAGVEPLLVWLDAHGDFNTPTTTPSGFIGGMPLAMIVGLGEQELIHAAALRPLRESDVFLADARNLDPGERASLERSGVRRVGSLADLPALMPAGRPIYVHLDTDVLDPAEAPAMLYPTPGGPSLAEFRDVAERLAATGRVIAVSMTVWNLGADLDGGTGRVCRAALASLVGEGRDAGPVGP